MLGRLPAVAMFSVLAAACVLTPKLFFFNTLFEESHLLDLLPGSFLARYNADRKKLDSMTTRTLKLNE
jgi:hypothetical protein